MPTSAVNKNIAFEQARIGQYISRTREQQGLTQAEFSRALKTSQSAVARMEKGLQNLTTLAANQADLGFAQLDTLQDMKSSDEGIAALQAVLARNPRHFPSLLAVAQIYESEERWTEAGEALQKATAGAVVPYTPQ